ncbi:hypothetical protein [Enorma burkinafasonensis]|uniref:hypothetical protein n=1 Tax=Enorma burkinafasonensis TaxID=2590867 RepID=UPI0011A3540A|nr:hypothetical protein [Enorma burkinafasonensis]
MEDRKSDQYPGADELLRSFSSALQSLVDQFGGIDKPNLNIPQLSEGCDDGERRKALRSLLKEMASVRPEDALSDADIDATIEFFNRLYGGTPKYRHSYADICDTMFSLLEESEELDCGVPYQVNSLAENINIVYARMTDGGDAPSTQAESVLKLCDHIELERTRLRHYVEQSNRIRDFNERRKELERDAVNNRKELEEKFTDKVDSMRMEYIAILGVFAAIVLAFNGAVGFSTSSLSALGTASGLRALVFLTALVGFVLIDAISILFVFLWKMSFNGKIEIGNWPVRLLIGSNAVLVLIMILCAALSHPCVRSFVGLPH